MSVIIKGIGMPTGNDELRLIIHSNGQVIISHKTYFDETEAILVPPHGRLIDADALEQDAQKRLLICNKYDDQFQKPYEVMRAIALAPTILDAEVGE